MLQISDLSVGFRTPRGVVQALSDVSLTIAPGELLLVVGESGSGKTVLAHSLLRLLPRNATVNGSVKLHGRELLRASAPELRAIRAKRLALIPQSPASALNPVRRLGPQLLEAARGRGSELRLRQLLTEFGLEWEFVARRYVHQLSGGMQQRVVNAVALLGSPDVVIADEPTSGLDADLVDTTAAELRAIADRGTALLVITHDLRLAERLGGRLALLYASRIVELGPTREFFAAPSHPYGRELLRALPEREGKPIPGTPPELIALPSHCAFAPRCPDRFARCTEAQPDLVPVSADTHARCFARAAR
jgi:peptide/nickel transport system ATP-binding protein